MKHVFSLLLLTAALNIACSSQQKEDSATELDIDSLALVLEGDSTVYGLVCDGHTDTILVFLPLNDIQSDPDTFNILNASRKRNVFGRLKIGDHVAVVRNQADSTVADFVIDTDDLQNTWCYEVLHTLHKRADMDGKTESQMIANLPDSLRELLLISREYGISIKGDHTMFAFGDPKKTVETEEDHVVDYPPLRHYGRWGLLNGKLLMTVIEPDTLGQLQQVAIDTAEFVMMDRDTLVLRFNDGLRNYYRKKETSQD